MTGKRAAHEQAAVVVAFDKADVARPLRVRVTFNATAQPFPRRREGLYGPPLSTEADDCEIEAHAAEHYALARACVGLRAGAPRAAPRIVPAVSERGLRLNGIELRIVEEGAGPLVVLCHGFPELAFSWRHQIPVLARAGYRVVAPDMRGFGESSAPADIDAYDVRALCGDMTALLDTLDEESAIFVGHDWGASLVWSLALLEPSRVRAVAGLSVPFVPRAPAAPIPIMRRHLGDDFYIVWFQEPGPADEALASDVRRTLTTSRQCTAAWADETDSVPKLAPWLSEDELAVYVEAFERTGFTGGLNWYRNIDRNWELTESVADRHVVQPAFFLTGELDPVRRFMPAAAMQGWVDDLRAEIVVPDAGHWVQQQAPDVVNAALLEFLASL
jgi:pimeloyl-ACP methyl ester carboxylesterase